MVSKNAFLFVQLMPAYVSEYLTHGDALITFKGGFFSSVFSESEWPDAAARTRAWPPPAREGSSPKTHTCQTILLSCWRRPLALYTHSVSLSGAVPTLSRGRVSLRVMFFLRGVGVGAEVKGTTVWVTGMYHRGLLCH